MQNDLGSLPSRSTGFAGFGCPVGVVGPKVGILPSERDDPKGPKASRQKQNGVSMTRVLTNRLEVAKNYENRSVWWFSLRCVLVTFGAGCTPVRLFNSFCSSLPALKNRARMIRNGF